MSTGKLARLCDVVVVTGTTGYRSFGYLNLADLDHSGPWEDAGAGNSGFLIAGARMGGAKT